MPIVGSILHGAYGDYYEQLVCLKYFKTLHPDARIVLFFESESRRRELQVFDMSFADALLPASALTTERVDRFVQFQVKDGELREGILNKLPPELLEKIDVNRNIKPWTWLRTIVPQRRDLCDIPLSPLGQSRLPECMSQNEIPAGLFQRRFTIGFLWRYRAAGGSISGAMQQSQDWLIDANSRVLANLIKRFDAHVLVCGMNVAITAENRSRLDAKYCQRRLDLDPQRATYLKALSWGLELETLRQCSLCLVMASGFSEALWLKRREPTMLVHAPYHYLAKAMWNRIPLFDLMRPTELAFQLCQPHTPERIINHLRRRRVM